MPSRSCLVAALSLLCLWGGLAAGEYTPLPAPPGSLSLSEAQLGILSTADWTHEMAEAAAAAFAQPTTLRCVIINDQGGDNNYMSGYAGLKQPPSAALAAALPNLLPGGLLPLTAGDVDGYAVRLMQVRLFAGRTCALSD